MSRSPLRMAFRKNRHGVWTWRLFYFDEYIDTGNAASQTEARSRAREARSKWLRLQETP